MKRLASAAIKPKRATNCSAFAERFVLSIKFECLDMMIFFCERGLRDAISVFFEHFHAERGHQGRGNRRIKPGLVGEGVVVCDERLGGLLNCYRRSA